MWRISVNKLLPHEEVDITTLKTTFFWELNIPEFLFKNSFDVYRWRGPSHREIPFGFYIIDE
jgi:hypothetical protein